MPPTATFVTTTADAKPFTPLGTKLDGYVVIAAAPAPPTPTRRWSPKVVDAYTKVVYADFLRECESLGIPKDKRPTIIEVTDDDIDLGYRAVNRPSTGQYFPIDSTQMVEACAQAIHQPVGRALRAMGYQVSQTTVEWRNCDEATTALDTFLVIRSFGAIPCINSSKLRRQHGQPTRSPWRIW